MPGNLQLSIELKNYYNYKILTNYQIKEKLLNQVRPFLTRSDLLTSWSSEALSSPLDVDPLLLSGSASFEPVMNPSFVSGSSCSSHSESSDFLFSLGVLILPFLIPADHQLLFLHQSIYRCLIQLFLMVDLLYHNISPRKTTCPNSEVNSLICREGINSEVNFKSSQVQFSNSETDHCINTCLICLFWHDYSSI